MLKVSLYFDQSKSKLADYQTYSVAVDVASLTQEQIVDILSDSGKFKGLYYEKMRVETRHCIFRSMPQKVEHLHSAGRMTETA